MDKPSTLEEIYEQQAFWSQRCDRARAREAAAKKTVEQCYKHLGVVTMVEQLRDLLQPHFPDHELEVLGPFGLANETSIHAKVADGVGRRSTVGSLSFRPHHVYTDAGNAQLREPGMVLTLVDWSRNTGQYPANSIGGRNQLNFPDKELPPTVEEIADLLGASIAEHATQTV